MFNPKAKCVCSKSLQLHPTLFNPMDCSPPGSSVHRILQARILEQVALPFSKGSSWPKDRTWVSCIADRSFTTWATGEAQKWIILHLKSCSKIAPKCKNGRKPEGPKISIMDNLPSKDGQLDKVLGWLNRSFIFLCKMALVALSCL